MVRPPYDELLEALAELMVAALTINDNFKVHADHAEFEGSMNQVEHLREVVNRLHNRYVDVLYPDDQPEEK